MKTHRPKNSRNKESIFKPSLTNPPNNLITNSNYTVFRPAPIFKYMKSPLSQKTRKMLEEAFIPLRILNLTSGKENGFYTPRYRRPLKVVKIDYKLQTTNHKRKLCLSPPTPHKQLQRISHIQTKSNAFSPRNLISELNNTERIGMKTTHNDNNWRHCCQEDDIFAKNKNSYTLQHRRTFSEQKDANFFNAQKQGMQLEIKTYNTIQNTKNKSNNKNAYHYNHQQKDNIQDTFNIRHSHKKNTLLLNTKKIQDALTHRKKRRIKTFIPLESKAKTLIKTFNEISIIEDHLGKAYNTHNPKIVNFSASHVLNLPSFSVFGICHGSGPNAFLVASTASHYFSYTLTSNTTYNVSCYPSSNSIEKAIVSNSYQLLISIMKNVENEVSNSLPFSGKNEYNLSYGLVIIIGKSIIHINKGKKIANITLLGETKNQMEMIYSMRQCKRSEGLLFSFEHLEYKNNMRYIILCSSKVACSSGWKNISKIICDENKRKEPENEYYDIIEYNKRPLLSLLDKIEHINTYLHKINEINNTNNKESKILNCYAILIVKCISNA
jgi:hypothetical protein